MLRINVEHFALLVIDKLGSEILESQKVGIKTSASYLVAARFCHSGVSESSQEWSHEQHAASESGTLLHILVAVEIFEVDVIGLECIVVARVACHLYTDFFEQLDKVVDVENVGYVGDVHRLVGEQRSCNHFKCLVFGSLRSDGSAECMSTLDYECFHSNGLDVRVSVSMCEYLSAAALLALGRTVLCAFELEVVEVELYVSGCVSSQV